MSSDWFMEVACIDGSNVVQVAWAPSKDVVILVMLGADCQVRVLVHGTGALAREET